MLNAAAGALKARPEEILDFRPLNRGMTNKSYVFTYRGAEYIMRIPGEGTGLLIDREKERASYKAIEGKGLSDELVAFLEQGRKISRFHPDARTCDPENRGEVGACMDKLRQMHGMGLSVGHGFDLFGTIDYYESLRKNRASVHPDYGRVKERVLGLRALVPDLPASYGLAHVDAVCDNFLLTEGRVLLIDWEYAGMCDQHLDLAMFAVYSGYGPGELDWLLGRYFPEGTPYLGRLRLKLYCFGAAAGLLWSNWCEYKALCGADFGEYAERQYRYASEFPSLVERIRRNDA